MKRSSNTPTLYSLWNKKAASSSTATIPIGEAQSILPTFASTSSMLTSFETPIVIDEVDKDPKDKPSEQCLLISEKESHLTSTSIVNSNFACMDVGKCQDNSSEHCLNTGISVEEPVQQWPDLWNTTQIQEFTRKFPWLYSSKGKIGKLKSVYN